MGTGQGDIFAHIGLLAMHAEEGGVESVEPRQLSSTLRQPRESHWPPLIVRCDLRQGDVPVMWAAGIARRPHALLPRCAMHACAGRLPIWAPLLLTMSTPDTRFCQNAAGPSDWGKRQLMPMTAAMLGQAFVLLQGGGCCSLRKGARES